MTSKRVAVVTGSNKGIGFGIVRGLCKQFNGDVFLTSRDEGRGTAAVEELNKEGLHPKFHQLDIDDHSSVQRLHDFLKENYGGLDILVNNAAIAYKGNSTAPFPEQAEVTNRTNFFNTLHICNVLFPLLHPHARVVNVSSFVSQWSLAKVSPEMKARVLAIKSSEEIKELMTEFVENAKAGTHIDNGFTNSAYGMSKLGITVLSMVQQTELDAMGKEDIVVNGACPGFVATDMTKALNSDKKITIDQGADNPLYAALLPENVKEPRGKFLRERKVAEWE